MIERREKKGWRRQQLRIDTGKKDVAIRGTAGISKRKHVEAHWGSISFQA